MSSRPSLFLDGDFVQDMYVQVLTDEQIHIVLECWEPHRESIENTLESFDEENQSWRAYRNAAFDWLPDPLKALPNANAPREHKILEPSELAKQIEVIEDEWCPNRVGKFKIASVFVMRDWNDYLPVFADFVVLRAEHMVAEGHFEYTAFSQHFDIVAGGEVTPWYDIEVTHDEESASYEVSKVTRNDN